MIFTVILLLIVENRKFKILPVKIIKLLYRGGCYKVIQMGGYKVRQVGGYKVSVRPPVVVVS